MNTSMLSALLSFGAAASHAALAPPPLASSTAPLSPPASSLADANFISQSPASTSHYDVGSFTRPTPHLISQPNCPNKVGCTSRPPISSAPVLAESDGEACTFGMAPD